MKKLSILLLALVCLLAFDACKKDPKTPPAGGGEEMTTKAIQVVLPAGVSLDFTQTTLLTLSKPSTVGADGKANVPYVKGSHEFAYLFDVSNNLLMMGIISDDNSEISMKSTTEALLFLGTGIEFSTSEAQKTTLLKKLPGYTPFATLHAKLEELFKADVTMLSKNDFMASFATVVEDIMDIPTIDVYAKQVRVEDADALKSGIIITEDPSDAESLVFVNNYVRRSHAFLYKIAFRNLADVEVSRIHTIENGTAADQQMPVKGGEIGSNQIVSPVVTGPVSLPLLSTEKQATYKVRVVGVGGDASSGLTNAENTKLEELWVEFFALDLLMPVLLQTIGHTEAQYAIRSNNSAVAQPFIDEVKAHLNSNVLQMIKDGKHIEAVKEYLDYVELDYYKRVALQKKLSEVGKAATQATNWGQTEEDINDEQTRTGKLTALINKWNEGVKIHLNDMLTLLYKECNTMDEWTVKIMDNDVKLTPRNSDVMRFVNHKLTLNAKPVLDAGETVEYEWATSGTYGTLKSGSQEATTFTNTDTTIIYYGKNAPDDDKNIDYVYVTVYIKNGNNRKVFGKDTATINVKKAIMEMRPDDATLSPSKGISSVKLYIVNADGSNPLANNTGQYKIEWNTPGSYGHFAGGITQSVTSGNSITYIATDDEVQNAVENITARVYFKISSGWVQIQEVKGTVNIDNELKKKIIHVPIGYMHGDSTTMNGTRGLCYWAFIASVPEEPNAVKFEARVLSTTYYGASGYPTYSWNATGPYPNTHAHYVIPPYTNGTFNISFGNSGGTKLPGEHIDFAISGMTGIAEITIYTK